MLADSPAKWSLLQKGFMENGWQDPKWDKEGLRAISYNLKALVNELSIWNDMCKIKTEERKGCAAC